MTNCYLKSKRLRGKNLTFSLPSVGSENLELVSKLEVCGVESRIGAG